MTQGIKTKKRPVQQRLKERNNKPAPSKKPKDFRKQSTLRKVRCIPFSSFLLFCISLLAVKLQNKKVVSVQQIENLLSGTAVSVHEHIKYLANKLK